WDGSFGWRLKLVEGGMNGLLWLLIFESKERMICEGRELFGMFERGSKGLGVVGFECEKKR
ncbi:hypothetical protein, partial [Bacillus pumilus]|uniref:hypothetical protein n=1 Tax=Bacillus pumilus TaxID=1408 RepID=UPI001C92DFC8